MNLTNGLSVFLVDLFNAEVVRSDILTAGTALLLMMLESNSDTLGKQYCNSFLSLQ